MAEVKFSRSGNIMQEPNSIKAVDDKVELLKRDLQRILSNLDEQNLSNGFMKKNNLK